MHQFYSKDESFTRIQKEIANLESSIELKKELLEKMEDDPEFNRFETGEEAEDVLEEKFLERARNACEGSYNLGEDKYVQELFIAGEPYIYTLTVEYNRHDKTYYYVDGYDSTMVRKPSPITKEELGILEAMIEPGTSRFEVLLKEYRELKGW